MSEVLFNVVRVESAGSFYAVWLVPKVEVTPLIQAICQVDIILYETENILMIIVDGKLLYLRAGYNSVRRTYMIRRIA